MANWISKLLLKTTQKQWERSDWIEMVGKVFGLLPHPKGPFRQWTEPDLGAVEFINRDRDIRIRLVSNLYWLGSTVVSITVQHTKKYNFPTTNITKEWPGDKIAEIAYDIVKTVYDMIDNPIKYNGGLENEDNDNIEPEFDPSPKSPVGVFAMQTPKFKVSQTDLRPPYTDYYQSCPSCGVEQFFKPQRYENCPKCNRPTQDLEEYVYECPDCETRIFTGKMGDCKKCGFDWKPRSINLNEPVSNIQIHDYDFGYITSWLKIRTIADLIRKDYDVIKDALAKHLQYESKNYASGRGGYIGEQWIAWSDMSVVQKQENIHNQLMGRLDNLITNLYHGSSYQFIQYPVEYKKWIQYLFDSLNKDQDIGSHQKKEENERQEYFAKMEKEEKEKEQKAQLLADELHRHKNEIWSDMEEITPEEALRMAHEFLKNTPEERSLWRPKIREISRKLFSRKEFPDKPYFMSPDEASSYIAGIQDRLDQEFSNQWSLAPDDFIVDVLSKTVGITGTHPQNTNWARSVHPGYTVTRILGPAALLKIQANEELLKRISEYKNDQAKLQKLYALLDADLRSVYFSSKKASSNQQYKTAQVDESDLEPVDGYSSYTRYIWATKQEIEQMIQQNNGMPMNSIGDGWFGVHVGGDEWISILQQDYSRSGPVCEVEFSNLPEGFYVTNDPDLSIGGKVDSYMIISKSPIIPAEYITIQWEKDTAQAAEDSGFEYGDDYWQMASRKNWLTKIATAGSLIAYHATVAGSKIMSEGFKTRQQLSERAALGGGCKQLPNRV